MFTAGDLVWGVLLPAIIAAALMAVAVRPWQNVAERAIGYWGGSQAIALAFIVSFFGILRRWPAPQRDATDWLCLIAAIAAIAGAVDGLCIIPAWTRRSVAVGLIALFCWLVLHPLSGMSEATRTAWIFAATVSLSIWWALLENVASAERGPIVPILLTIVAGSSAVVLMLSGSKLLGQLGGSVAAALGACMVVAWVSKAVSLERGGVFAAVALIGCLLIYARFYASLTAVNATLLVAAGLLSGAGTMVPSKRLHGWKRHLSQLIVVALPAVTAIGLAAYEFVESMEEYPY